MMNVPQILQKVLLSVNTVNTGLEGTPIPYRLHADDGITAILFFCFFLSAYVLSSGKRYLLQQAKDYLFIKERSSLFQESMGINFGYRLALLLLLCILLGISFFDFFNSLRPELEQHYNSLLIVGIYVLFCVCFYLLKGFLYQFTAWIFFDKTRGRILNDSYFFILCGLSLALFPVVLLAVYFDLEPQIIIPLTLGVIIFAKILFFYKCIKLFFDNLYGLLCLIVYFCALEIMPSLILYKALDQVNNLLLIKL